MAAVLVFAHAAFDTATQVSLGLWWPVVALCGLLVSAGTTLTVLAIQRERYAAVSASRLTKPLVSLGLQATLALTILPGLAGLAAGEIIGAFSATGLLYLQLRKVDVFASMPRPDRTLHRKYIFGIARKYSIFPLASLPQVFSGSVAALLTAILVASFFSAHEAGQWFMMQRVAMLPAGLVGTSMAQIYFAEAATSIRRDGSFAVVFRRVAVGQALIGLFVATILTLFGGFLFPFVLGNNWIQAGQLSVIYAPYVAVHLVLSTLAATTILSKRQTQAFLVGLGQNLVFLGALALACSLQVSVEVALSVAVWASVPYMLAVVGWYWTLSRGAAR